MLRLTANIRAIVSSAVAMLLAPGVFMTTTPLIVAALTSMLSTPTPARPTTRSFLPAASTSAVTCVPLRTISPSYSGMTSSSCSLLRPVFTSTLMSACSFRRSRAAAPSLSETSILYIVCLLFKKKGTTDYAD